MRILLVHLVPSSLLGVGVLATAGPSSAVPAEPSYVTMYSESRTWVVGGVSRAYTEPRDGIAVRVDSQLITVSVTGGTPSAGSYGLRFATPGPLAPGHYPDAMRHPFQSGGRPGLDISGEGRGCNTVAGEFTILEIGAGRPWLTYEHHCDGDPAIFGEIRIGMPDDGPAHVAARSVAWPAADPGVAVAPALVPVVNSGTAPFSVSSVAVLAGGSDFSVRTNSCTSALAPGERCLITVGFTPSRPGERRGSLRTADSAGGLTDVALGGGGFAGRTFWTMDSDSGDWVGGGGSYQYEPVTGASIRGYGTATQAHFAASPAAATGEVRRLRGALQILEPGATYAGAMRYPFNHPLAGLDLGGNGRGCNTLSGRFTVHEIDHHDDGTVSGLRIAFEQHCQSETPALRGEIALGADDPGAPPPDTTAPSPVASLSAGAPAAEVTVSWSNPTDADWADTVGHRLHRGSPRHPNGVRRTRDEHPGDRSRYLT